MLIFHKVRNIRTAITMRLFFEFSCNILQYLIFQRLLILIFTRQCFLRLKLIYYSLYPRQRPGTHFTGSWVGLRAGLDRCGKSRPTGIRSPERAAHRQSLYRLRYPPHRFHVHTWINILFSGNTQGDVFTHNFYKYLTKIKEIRRIMKRFIYAIKTTANIEDTFYTAHSPTSLYILLDRT
jgi:hypothetical protein